MGYSVIKQDILGVYVVANGSICRPRNHADTHTNMLSGDKVRANAISATTGMRLRNHATGRIEVWLQCGEVADHQIILNGLASGRITQEEAMRWLRAQYDKNDDPLVKEGKLAEFYIWFGDMLDKAEGS